MRETCNNGPVVRCACASYIPSKGPLHRASDWNNKPPIEIRAFSIGDDDEALDEKKNARYAPFVEGRGERGERRVFKALLMALAGAGRSQHHHHHHHPRPPSPSSITRHGGTTSTEKKKKKKALTSSISLISISKRWISAFSSWSLRRLVCRRVVISCSAVSLITVRRFSWAFSLCTVHFCFFCRQREGARKKLEIKIKNKYWYSKKKTHTHTQHSVKSP